MKFWSELLQALCAAVLPVAAVWAIRLLRELVGKALERVNEVSPDIAGILQAVCLTAVRAAEQIYGGGAGAEKLRYASGVAETMLQKYGLTLDLSLIRAAVEAAVYTEFGHKGPAPEGDWWRTRFGS